MKTLSLSLQDTHEYLEVTDLLLAELLRSFDPEISSYDIIVHSVVQNNGLVIYEQDGNTIYNNANGAGISYGNLKDMMETALYDAKEKDVEDYRDILLALQYEAMKSTGFSFLSEPSYEWNIEDMIRGNYILHHTIHYKVQISSETLEIFKKQKRLAYVQEIEKGKYSFEKLSAQGLSVLVSIQQMRGKIHISEDESKQLMDSSLFLLLLLVCAIDGKIELQSYKVPLKLRLKDLDQEKNGNENQENVEKFYSHLETFLGDTRCKEIMIQKEGSGNDVKLIVGKKKYNRDETIFVELQSQYPFAQISSHTHKGRSQGYMVDEKIKLK